jgi:hypothetical protein
VRVVPVVAAVDDNGPVMTRSGGPLDLRMIQEKQGVILVAVMNRLLMSTLE